MTTPLTFDQQAQHVREYKAWGLKQVTIGTIVRLSPGRLKHDRPCDCRRRRTTFPSPKGGGPIEAWGRSTTTTWRTLFPSPKGGGPIEAWS